MPKSRALYFTIGLFTILSLFSTRSVCDILGDRITSDTEIDWDSCEVAYPTGSHDYVKRSYVQCTSPTRVWMALAEAPYLRTPEYEAKKIRSAIHLDDVFRDFRNPDVPFPISPRNSHNERVMIIGQGEPWPAVFSQDIVKRDQVADEVLAHGGVYTRVDGAFYRAVTCLSNTDSHTLCKNAVKPLLFQGFESKLPKK